MELKVRREKIQLLKDYPDYTQGFLMRLLYPEFADEIDAHSYYFFETNQDGEIIRTENNVPHGYLVIDERRVIDVCINPMEKNRAELRTDCPQVLTELWKLMANGYLIWED